MSSMDIEQQTNKQYTGFGLDDRIKEEADYSTISVIDKHSDLIGKENIEYNSACTTMHNT
eukprot:CAMPEP_0170532122 /NCGR_PEP_ID=MMETSP0209-20121228/68663_1 /TAXON_ID=665100 ORGANISM="Litonotus pictus, Strain P1" /NCGR_SAMPLE_ID=MMETSP0209 /ASSEMBLY_ACC=CAM_ASM_000301 /LENGTH=59 /DNA_ID=CAMNT_0010827773 /DNA_START=30 /DNA_END=205 /DNA_ORIENTATION=+